jgi:hypothetical protein
VHQARELSKNIDNEVVLANREVSRQNLVPARYNLDSVSSRHDDLSLLSEVPESCNVDKGSTEMRIYSEYTVSRRNMLNLAVVQMRSLQRSAHAVCTQ